MAVPPRRPTSALTSFTNYQFDWDEIVIPDPRNEDYSINASTEDLLLNGMGNYTASGPHRQGQLCRVNYLGVDRRGRNLGVTAIIKTMSHSRVGFSDEARSATGTYPYFQTNYQNGIGNGTLHRGHLLARSLNGVGTRINWVPLKGGQNIAEWNHVESEIFNYLKENHSQGAWAEIRITLDYKFYNIPVPASISYRCALCRVEGDDIVRIDIDRTISNNLHRDGVSETLKQMWA